MSTKTPIVGRLGNASFHVWFPLFRWLAAHIPDDALAEVAEVTVERCANPPGGRAL